MVPRAFFCYATSAADLPAIKPPQGPVRPSVHTALPGFRFTNPF